jgi:hypothetical protein
VNRKKGRGKRKGERHGIRRDSKREDGLGKRGGKKGEDLAKALPAFRRAYENGSRIVDPRAAKTLVSSMLNMVVQNIDCPLHFLLQGKHASPWLNSCAL